MNNNFLRVRLNLLTYDYDFCFPLGIFMKTFFFHFCVSVRVSHFVGVSYATFNKEQRTLFESNKL